MGNTVFITGMSGAGKSRAINALEDMGYYCVDNLPASLATTFADLVSQSRDKLSNVAIVIDMRDGENVGVELSAALRELTERGIAYKVLFLEASVPILVRRYRETRRRHPLAHSTGSDVASAIERERELLTPLRSMADYIIDTSNSTPAQLRERIVSLFSTEKSSGMAISCVSFGFKYGVPTDADLVFDVRCLPNPFYVDELKHHTGLEEPVKKFIFSHKSSNEFLGKIIDFIDYALPLYAEEGKSQLVIAIGCTGGRHRSVAFAQAVADHIGAEAIHRDITK